MPALTEAVMVATIVVAAGAEVVVVTEVLDAEVHNAVAVEMMVQVRAAVAATAAAAAAAGAPNVTRGSLVEVLLVEVLESRVGADVAAVGVGTVVEIAEVVAKEDAAGSSVIGGDDAKEGSAAAMAEPGAGADSVVKGNVPDLIAEAPVLPAEMQRETRSHRQSVAVVLPLARGPALNHIAATKKRMSRTAAMKAAKTIDRPSAMATSSRNVMMRVSKAEVVAAVMVRRERKNGKHWRRQMPMQ